MKLNENLELMLNKVVEYKTDENCFRGFLYRVNSSYYIKIIDIDYTTESIYNDSKYYINVDNAKNIKLSDKPKLMKVSLKSWHYRLVKYVLKSNAPTPKNMQNGCPYFWLLMFSILVVPFIWIGRIFGKLLNLIHNRFDKMIEKMVDNWIQSLPDYKAYDIYHKETYTLPLLFKYYYDDNNYKFYNDYLEKKYGVVSSSDWCKKNEDLRKQWNSVYNEISEKKRKKRELKRLKNNKPNIIETLFDKLTNNLDKIGDWFNSLFTPKDWKTIIKHTKQIVGVLVTLVLTAIAYLVMYALTILFIIIIDGIANNIDAVLYVITIIFITILGLGLIIGLYYILIKWIKNIITDYEFGERKWYIDLIINYIYTPLLFIIRGLFLIIKYVLYYPIIFISVTVIWRLLKSIWKLFVGSTGIFGEYFNASYTAYCPGIEWVDTDDEEE